jgi:hypothetical protein
MEPLDGSSPSGPDGVMDGDRAGAAGRADTASDDATGTCEPEAKPDLEATPGK